MEHLSDRELVARTRRLVCDERRITGEILAHINEVERRRLFADLGYPSLFEWLTKDLKYSAAAAYRRIQAARLLAAVPEASARIENGELNLTTLAQVQTAIRNEERRSGERIAADEKRNILCSIESASSLQTEAVLIQKFPESARSSANFEKTREQVADSNGETLSRVELTMTRSQMKKIERVRELTSHSQVRASIADIIEMLTDDFLNRKDPMLKKPREKPADAVKIISTKNVTIAESVPSFATQGETAAEATRVNSRSGWGRRKPLKISVRDFVFRRANSRCEFQDLMTKRRCGSRHFLEVDHILPVALGGGDESENLRLLCRTHNLLMARRILGVACETQNTKRAIEAGV